MNDTFGHAIGNPVGAASPLARVKSAVSMLSSIDAMSYFLRVNQTPPPLHDDEIVDRLRRMAFELEHLKGETMRGDTALKTSRAALMMTMAGLIRASEPQP